jgi:hypothetical protein
MHNGAGGTVGYDLTGGAYTVNSWSYVAASNPNPGHYSALVQSDGALLYLSNAQVPEPSSVLLMGLGLAPVLRRRR